VARTAACTFEAVPPIVPCAPFVDAAPGTANAANAIVTSMILRILWAT
jgi:hypothetical protein